MMKIKRRACILFLIAVMALITACRQGSGAAGFSEADLHLTLDGTQYRLNTHIEEAIAVLGDSYEYSEGKSCDYDGLDKTFLYEEIEFYTWPMNEGDIINEIYTQSSEVTTSKGLCVGAAKSEVLAAYGSECEDTGYQLIYRLPDGAAGSLCFDMEGDTVTAVYITAQPV